MPGIEPFTEYVHPCDASCPRPLIAVTHVPPPAYAPLSTEAPVARSASYAVAPERRLTL